MYCMIISSSTGFDYSGKWRLWQGGKEQGRCWMESVEKMTALLCDIRALVKIEGMILRTVVRPATKVGVETAAMTKRQESQLGVAGMRTLRWQGRTRLGMSA